MSGNISQHMSKNKAFYPIYTDNVQKYLMNFSHCSDYRCWIFISLLECELESFCVAIQKSNRNVYFLLRKLKSKQYLFSTYWHVSRIDMKKEVGRCRMQTELFDSTSWSWVFSSICIYVKFLYKFQQQKFLLLIKYFNFTKKVYHVKGRRVLVVQSCE